MKMWAPSLKYWEVHDHAPQHLVEPTHQGHRVEHKHSFISSGGFYSKARTVLDYILKSTLTVPSPAVY